MARDDRFYVLRAEGNALTSGRRTVYVDRETGVEYLFVQVGYSGGLTPVVNPDGTPRIVPADDVTAE